MQSVCEVCNGNGCCGRTKMFFVSLLLNIKALVYPITRIPCREFSIEQQYLGKVKCVHCGGPIRRADAWDMEKDFITGKPVYFHTLCNDKSIRDKVYGKHHKAYVESVMQPDKLGVTEHA